MDEASTINADQDRLVGVVSDLQDLLGDRLQLGAAVRDAHGHDESWHETHAPDAVAFAVLIANFAAPFIDHYTQPRTYGHKKVRDES